MAFALARLAPASFVGLIVLAAQASGEALAKSAPAASCVIEAAGEPPAKPGAPLPAADTAARVLWQPGRWTDFALSPDGTRVATIGGSDDVMLWELASCVPSASWLVRDKPRRRGFWHWDGAEGTSLFFSPDGTTVFAGSSASRVATSERLPALPHSPTRLFSPDGGWLFLEAKARLLPWNLRTWQPAAAPLDVEHRSLFSGVPGNDYTARFSRDSRRLALSSDEKVLLWDLTRGEPDGPPLTHPDTVADLVFSPGGDALAVVGWRQVTLWRLAQRSLLASLTHAGGGLLRKMYGSHSRLVWSPDGRFVAWTAGEAGTPQGEVYVWDALGGPNGALVFQTHWRGNAPATAFSPDGRRLVVADRSDRLTIFDLPPAEGGTSPVVLGEPPGQSELCIAPCLSVSADGSLLVARRFETVELWRVSTSPPPRLWLIVGVKQVTPFGTSALLVRADSGIFVIDFTERERPLRRVAIRGAGPHVLFSEDGRVVATYTRSKQGTLLKVWPPAALAALLVDSDAEPSTR